MMKKSAFMVSLFAAATIFAQDAPDASSIYAQLEKYKITPHELILNAQPVRREYAFDMQVETMDLEYPVTYTASYDPTRDPAWEMTSWNGKPAEKYQQNILYDRVKRFANVPVIIDKATLKSYTEDAYLVISFRIDPGTAPKEYMYLKDCDAKSYIDTITGQLDKTVWENFQPTKNQAVRVNKIQEEVTFMLVFGTYHVQKEVLRMEGRVETSTGEAGGQADQVITYSNYRKVK